MQITFTAEQLRDPDIRESDTILRTCAHPGFCNATYPTFVQLGDELDSPRGRIYLVKDMLEGGKPGTVDALLLTHLHAGHASSAGPPDFLEADRDGEQR